MKNRKLLSFTIITCLMLLPLESNAGRKHKLEYRKLNKDGWNLFSNATTIDQFAQKSLTQQGRMSAKTKEISSIHCAGIIGVGIVGTSLLFSALTFLAGK